MGKKRHTQDKMWISTTEHIIDWGGKGSTIHGKQKFQKPLFYCCAISFLPFSSPVATPDGTIFEFTNIVPYIQKYKKNPVNGDPFKLSDLIKLKFSKNEKGEYYCPITGKIFNEYSHIVAIKETGEVYSYDAYDNLRNVEPFSKQKIITLQNPNEPDRNINEFYCFKNGDDLNFEPKTENTMNLTNSQKKLMSKIQKEAGTLTPEAEYNNIHKRIKTQEGEEEDKQIEPPKPKKKKTFINPLKLKNPLPKDFKIEPKAFIQIKKMEVKNRHSSQTEGKASGSFTSTSLTPAYKNEFRMKNDQEIRKDYYQLIKSRQIKGEIELSTTLGKMSLLIHCDYCPKTGENFIELCESKYYNGLTFHRLIPEFMIQGGDPKGDGTGGTSYFGKQFEDEFHPKIGHNRKGILSMANSGSNTNGSQFFITFGPCTHLDGMHTAFGEVVGGKEVLSVMESIPTKTGDKPEKEIKILEATVLKNPYREIIAEILSKQFIADKKLKEEKTGGTWTNFRGLKEKKPEEPKTSSRPVIGKYMKK
ncbi:unnamed protein product [Moneuplotes crassus]|uniref:RING-type E3 ubiquitin transferase n=2 Tax=Euplotes crassus TaxID=5936 RepID=A0AAD1UHE4_EUPCR|nr:unnamed protein product [Moneuplotes crassus]